MHDEHYGYTSRPTAAPFNILIFTMDQRTMCNEEAVAHISPMEYFSLFLYGNHKINK